MVGLLLIGRGKVGYSTGKLLPFTAFQVQSLYDQQLRLSYAFFSSIMTCQAETALRGSDPERTRVCVLWMLDQTSIILLTENGRLVEDTRLHVTILKLSRKDCFKHLTP